MRRPLVIMAGVLASASCASLTVVDKKPDRETVEILLAGALKCRDVEGAELCKTEEQPKEIRLAALDCVALPLRSTRRESAHARCAYEGEIIRVNGVRETLARAESEFSLINLTPGLYRPTREWTIEFPGSQPVER